MTVFADTSLFCALFREQENSSHADAIVEAYRSREPIQLSALAVFEFRQSVRLQSFRLAKDRLQGFSKKRADAMIDQLDQNVVDGFFAVAPVDWADIYSLAERFSLKHTFERGHRTADILHVVAALHLKAKTFLSFDTNQIILAKKEGLKVPS
jgi:predicted nucleic acid-binding protein